MHADHRRGEGAAAVKRHTKPRQRQLSDIPHSRHDRAETARTLIARKFHLRSRLALTIAECSVNYASRQQLKGGDPVSHCLSPRSPASVSWVPTSTGLGAV